ncbi:hypothetical protein LTR56_025013 [Elasticomyces elasticus]|nr:hypothetical protein LTR56_025013 [Elasticomyces elasticus]KAK3645805.1 hypothetical protein LTR22_014573 [Elasticomyces elasticus]KAK4906618.1 hypothetical protein LTR49_024265 [Elasticomyces elasticus]KAK5741558.1 hypothetical protein LTS12_024566 [Elasticomyces elasticus]
MSAALLLLAALPCALGLARLDGVGRLPALGWNSWNAYFCDVDEAKLLDAANLIISLGLKDAGYEYVNIDDCWSIKDGRDATTQQIVPDPNKFPNGIIGVASEIHNLGLKTGIYSSAGTETCAGYPASIGYESIDAATFAGWGIDYLKYDNCYVPGNWSDASPSGADYDYSTSNTANRYMIMRDALLAQNRTILYSLCEWGQANVWTWGNETGNSWRTTGDITPDWNSVISILNQQSSISQYTDFTGHNDPDMLEVGNGNLTLPETRSHFALWALMKAPLIIGTDLSKLSPENLEILLNKYLLAFNQDPVYGVPAEPYKWGVNADQTNDRTNPAEFWSGGSSNGTMVAMLNTQDTTRMMRADFSEIPGLDAGTQYKIVDAWTGKSAGCIIGGLDAQVEGHDTAVYLVQSVSEC